MLYGYAYCYPAIIGKKSIDDLIDKVFAAYWNEVDGNEMLEKSGGASLQIRPNEVKYGRLYNYYSIANLAPSGWHVPTDEDWKTLEEELGMSEVEADTNTAYRGTNEGSKLAGNEALWTDGNLDSNAAFGDSGMTLLPGGYRNPGGAFNSRGTTTNWLTATEIDADNCYCRQLVHLYPTIYRGSFDKNVGAFIRLVKDDSTDPGTLTDADGNIYDTIKIGNQVWTVQNFASTKYADGSAIPEITDNTEWSNDTSGAYCEYDNSETDVYESAYSEPLTTSYIPASFTGKIVAPNVAALKLADVNNILYDAGGSSNLLGVSDFIDDDLPRIPVKFDDLAPHDIYEIGLFDPTAYAALTTAEKKRISNYMNLWVFYWGVWYDAGSFDKENRTI